MINPKESENKHEQDKTANDPADTSVGHEYDLNTSGTTPDEKENNTDKSGEDDKESRKQDPRKDIETLKQDDSAQTNKNDLIPPAQA